jgi:hypothetical protein
LVHRIYWKEHIEKVAVFTTSFPEYPTFSDRPAVPMNFFRRIIPILASTSQLTYSGKYSVPDESSYARICGPRICDLTLPSLPETKAKRVNVNNIHPPSE